MLVVDLIILIIQAGDQIPADSIIFDHNKVLANEASLTGEPDDLKKTKDGDPFLLSSCLITEGEEVRALVIGIGLRSQWGKIKANLVSEAVNTPLQDKLEDMTKSIGYVGMFASCATFIALIISIWARDGGKDIVSGFVNAFILSITVVVVSIPEGLPLAVTISLAYSTKKMYADNCFIRVLAACETLGNATTICSDKTGTLTENRMTVVEGWFADHVFDADQFSKGHVTEALGGFPPNGESKKIAKTSLLAPQILDILVPHIAVNRTAYRVWPIVKESANSQALSDQRPSIIGNKTEGALLDMIGRWGFQEEDEKPLYYSPDHDDRIYAFNSGKKRSTAVIHLGSNSVPQVRMFVKGASEWILKDCSHYLNREGKMEILTPNKREEIEKHLETMANKALRTLILTHRDFERVDDLPGNWHENPPDGECLCLDALVGIQDPLRADVPNAVRTAQEAGVLVRMVTGDNIATASAIARQCGILNSDGMALEGPKFRRMTPSEVDNVLPRLQVLARSSPEDKFLLVTRLNGYGLPNSSQEWEQKHANDLVPDTSKDAVMKKGFDNMITPLWATHRDALMPGYREEWEKQYPEGGQVVGVTGDGTNDAPALKAADVGLSMGITGTKVAQGASDIVLLDDRFSSIVRAMAWGRAVYDNIRKFLQFQLTVNVVALLLVFFGAVSGLGEPLNAVQMLWVNLVMDTLGALALGTEAPVPALLKRKPYKRSASLISRPMMRFIGGQSLFQLTLLMTLMFAAPDLFKVNGHHLLRSESGSHETICDQFSVKKTSTAAFVMSEESSDVVISDFSSTSAPQTYSWTLPSFASISCADFHHYCPDKHYDEYCYQLDDHVMKLQDASLWTYFNQSSLSDQAWLDNFATNISGVLNHTFSSSMIEEYAVANYSRLSSYEQSLLQDVGFSFRFIDLLEESSLHSHAYRHQCLSVCLMPDFTYETLIFNTFIFCQVFNEFNARRLFDEWNIFGGILNNVTFVAVFVITAGAQVFLVYFGGLFLKTTGLSLENFLITFGLGSLALVVGFLIKFFPIVEDPNSFFKHSVEIKVSAPSTSKDV